MNNINYSLSYQLCQLLRQQGKLLAVAESCTGGGLATEITAVAGSSDYFYGGFVTYSNQAKENLLGISSELIAQHGAVSEAVAKAMALGVIENTAVDIALSITGVAGPGGGSREKPVGTVWFGLAAKDGKCSSFLGDFGGGRKHVRKLAIGYALKLLLETCV